MCLSRDFEEFWWIGGVNTPNLTKKLRKLYEGHDRPDQGLEFVFVDTKEPKSQYYHITERNKLGNQVDLVNAMIDRVKKRLQGSPVVVGIEGFSYGSQGNSLVDLAHGTGILKQAILKELLNNKLELMFVFSPSELKNSIGEKGNCGKLEVFEAFMDDPMIEGIENHHFYQFIQVNKDELYKPGKEVKSPIMDMIDSYLSILKLRSMFLD
jgi:hypothetical protein